MGPAIRLEFLPKLSASRRRLYSDESRGEAVHAATFVRDRLITMEAELIRQPAEFRRILIHELFHFVWVRLGNTRRRGWQVLIEAELNAGARGELGWSAERRKHTGRSTRQSTGRAWREYLCESFCDTAAWLYSRQSHREFTLAARFRIRRARWMNQMATAGFLPI